MKIITLISLCDCIANASVLNGVPSDPDWCVLQAFAQQCFFAGSWLWTAILTYLLYSMVLYGKISLLEWQMHLIVWSLCAIVSIALLSTSPSFDPSHNMDDNWCWAQVSTHAGAGSAFIWPVFISNCFIFGTFLLMTFWASCIIYKLKIQKLPMKKTVQTALRILFQYPIILLITWFPSTIFLTIKPHTELDSIDFIVLYSLSVWQGGFTAIAFFIRSRESRQCWYQLFARCFHCLRNYNTDDLESMELMSVHDYQSEEDFESDDAYYGRNHHNHPQQEQRESSSNSRLDQTSADFPKISLETFRNSTQC
jgi:hypothetical protein